MKKTFIILFFFASLFFLTPGFALTTDEIIRLKKAGVSDDTIKIMLEQEKAGVREVKDDNGNVSIIYSTGSSSRDVKKDIEEEEKIKKAWKMLENIIIDRRQ